MPYIAPSRRDQIATPRPRFGVEYPNTAGELTWLLTEIIGQYRKRHGDSFRTYAGIVAALEQTKDEFRRRVVHPYEDDACQRNGDVYS